jgi:RNA polymerase sigma factor (sigma-70 family)
VAARSVVRVSSVQATQSRASIGAFRHAVRFENQGFRLGSSPEGAPPAKLEARGFAHEATASDAVRWQLVIDPPVGLELFCNFCGYQQSSLSDERSVKESKRFVALDERSETTEREQDSVTDSGDNKFREALFSYTLCAIQTLPVEDQEALILTEIDGLDRQELAEKLSISLSAAKSRVHRGRAKLRKIVDECCRLITDPYGRVIDWERRASKCCGPDRMVK